MNKLISTIFLCLLIPAYGFSATTQISGISDLVLLLLLGSFILLLLGVAYALAKSIEGVSKFPKVNQTEEKSDSNIKSKTLSLIGLIALSNQIKAAEITSSATDTAYHMSNLEFWVLIGTILVIFLVIGMLFKTLNTLVKLNNGESFHAEDSKDLFQTLNLTDNVPIEKEVDIMLDHEYDGIRELDNNLPPWWKYMFYGTIAFSFIYIFRFHISGDGKLQGEEYAMEIEAAVAEKAEMMASAAESITEDNVVYLIDAPTLAKGAAIYKGNCATCHGQLAEGGAGPNLTDGYWLHGGNIKDVFKTIKYGVPAKGMIAWQSQFSPSQMQTVASYVLSLQGSNPPNGKSPQGELYIEEVETTAGDTTTLVIEIDK